MNFNEMVHNLFLALDDTILQEYKNYEIGSGDYPSEFAIQALQSYQDEGFCMSKALEAMEENILTKELNGEL